MLLASWQLTFCIVHKQLITAGMSVAHDSTNAAAARPFRVTLGDQQQMPCCLGCLLLTSMLCADSADKPLSRFVTRFPCRTKATPPCDRTHEWLIAVVVRGGFTGWLEHSRSPVCRTWFVPRAITTSDVPLYGAPTCVPSCLAAWLH